MEQHCSAHKREAAAMATQRREGSFLQCKRRTELVREPAALIDIVQMELG